jgi:hypothetical protein
VAWALAHATFAAEHYAVLICTVPLTCWQGDSTNLSSTKEGVQ